MNKRTVYIIVAILILVIGYLVYKLTKPKEIKKLPEPNKIPVNTTYVSDPTNGLDADNRPSGSLNMSVPIFNSGAGGRVVPSATIPGPSATPSQVVIVANTSTPTNTGVAAPVSTPTSGPTSGLSGGSDTNQTTSTSTTTSTIATNTGTSNTSSGTQIIAE